MKTNRKLQVFVSSTFIDLQEERQAAVESILKAGHIPAGMELFKAGDESQWNIIKRWIEESDVYMLIIAGRYGSIEPNSGKSYTQLEYEYAIEKGKAFFAIVINDEWTDKKAKKKGVRIENFKEVHNLSKLNEFKAVVKKKMVSFANDLKDIKLAVGDSLNEINQRETLTGWVRADNTDLSKTLEEVTILSKENRELKNQLAELSKIERINGMSIGEFVLFLMNQKVEGVRFEDNKTEALIVIENILLYFYYLGKKIQGMGQFEYGKSEMPYFKVLKTYKFFEQENLYLTESGAKLLIYLEMNPHLLED